MHFLSRFALLSVLFIGGCYGQGNTTALEALLARQLPFHADKFVFHLQYETVVNMKTSADLDTFTIFDGTGDGKVHVECSTKSACSRGVYTYPTPASTLNSISRYFLSFSCLPCACFDDDRYLTEIAKVDIYWTGSRLGELPEVLPPVGSNISRQAIVPWRYHFNTGT